MEDLTPTKILRQVQAGKLDKASAIEYLITFIEGSENPQIRGENLQKFGQISSKNPKAFKYIENLLVSDESPLVRSIAAEVLLNDYPEDSVNPLKWAVQNDKSALFCKNVLNILEKIGGKVSEELRDKFFQRIGKYYGVYPDEARFFWDLICSILTHQNDMDLDEDGYNGCGKTRQYIIHGDAFYVERYGHITALTLAGWKLDTLPESIGAASKLKYLDVGGNSISKLPKALLNLSELRELDLSDTNLQNLPEWLKNLPKLRKINLSNNHFMSIPKWVLNFAKKYYSSLHILEGVTPSEAPILGLLDILLGKYNYLVKIDRDEEYLFNYDHCYKINDEGHVISICICFPEWPRIGVFPKQICDLTFLEELYLINNNLTHIPESITKLKNLRVLNLDYNEIYEIPESVMSFLETLDEYHVQNIRLHTEAEGRAVIFDSNKINGTRFDKDLREYDILLIEDDIETVNLLTNYFKIEGFSCKGLSGGIKCLEELQRFRLKEKQKLKPKILLIDLLLSDINAYDLIKKIRLDKAYNDLLIFLLSSIPETEVAKKSKELGTNGYILKPFNLSDFKIILECLKV